MSHCMAGVHQRRIIRTQGKSFSSQRFASNPSPDPQHARVLGACGVKHYYQLHEPLSGGVGPALSEKRTRTRFCCGQYYDDCKLFTGFGGKYSFRPFCPQACYFGNERGQRHEVDTCPELFAITLCSGGRSDFITFSCRWLPGAYGGGCCRFPGYFSNADAGPRSCHVASTSGIDDGSCNPAYGFISPYIGLLADLHKNFLTLTLFGVLPGLVFLVFSLAWGVKKLDGRLYSPRCSCLESDLRLQVPHGIDCDRPGTSSGARREHDSLCGDGKGDRDFDHGASRGNTRRRIIPPPLLSRGHGMHPDFMCGADLQKKLHFQLAQPSSKLRAVLVNAM